MSGRSVGSRRSKSSARSRKRARSSSTHTISPSPPRSLSRQRQYKSEIASLNLPVPRIKAMLQVYNYAPRVSDKAAVFLTSALEYILTEVMELSLNAARSTGQKRIKSKHINKILKKDPELLENFRNTHTKEGGFIPLPKAELSNGRASPHVLDEPSTSTGITHSGRSKRSRK